MLEHNGRQGSQGVDISYSPPPLAPPAWQLTSRQPWGLWLVMAYCLDPINAWPPLCPQSSHINKSNPVSGSSEPASDVGRSTRAGLHQVGGKLGNAYQMIWQKKKKTKGGWKTPLMQQEMATLPDNYPNKFKLQLRCANGRKDQNISSIPGIKSAPDVGKPSRNKLTH